MCRLYPYEKELYAREIDKSHLPPPGSMKEEFTLPPEQVAIFKMQKTMRRSQTETLMLVRRPRIIDVERMPLKCPVCKSRVVDIIYCTGDMTEVEFFLKYRGKL